MSAAVVRTPRNYELIGALPFVLVHLVCFAAFFTGVTWQAAALGVALYWIRMFGVTGGYHRYFSHRTFKTSRVGQFVLALLAQTSMQRGALWWAAHHRTHHKLSDLPGDVHSPLQDGFWYAHVLWLFNHNSDTDHEKVRDLARFPELRFLNTYFLLPPLVLGSACFLWMGWSGLVVGFFWSTVALWHGTFTINSLTHLIGKRRFVTTDDSRNSFALAILTLGEGWHNNHHHYMGSTRQGFYWWEIDLTYYVLRALAAVGLVWDLREPPEKVLAEGRALDAAQKRRPAEEPARAHVSLVPGATRRATSTP